MNDNLIKNNPCVSTLVKWHLSSCSKLSPYNDWHVKMNNMLPWLLPELEICLTSVFHSAADLWVFSSDKQLQWHVPWVLNLDTPPTTPPTPSARPSPPSSARAPTTFSTLSPRARLSRFSETRWKMGKDPKFKYTPRDVKVVMTPLEAVRVKHKYCKHPVHDVIHRKMLLNLNQSFNVSFKYFSSVAN